ncbi:MAG: hypothetical protein JNK66_10935 [Chitinophagales bacterium]|nr:hypothetical protein [Chitinophagales bacterium]
MTTKYTEVIKVQEPPCGVAVAGVGLVGGTPTNRKMTAKYSKVIKVQEPLGRAALWYVREWGQNKCN